MGSLKKEALKRITIDKAGKAYARTLRKTHGLPEEQFHTFQHDLLYKTYTDAITKVPYYTSRRHIYPTLSRDGLLEQFQRLPVLDKPTVKQQTTQFIRTPKSPFLLQLTTSGTTGSPLVIYQTPFERVKSNALRQSVHEAFCDVVSPRVLELSASLEVDQVSLRLSGTQHASLSIYHLTHSYRDQILDLLSTFQPEVIQGFPSALAQLARLLPEGLPYALPNQTVRCVASSETLFAETSEFIATTLGVIVHNEYGSQEGQHFAFSCADGGMHIHPARGYVEILAFNSNEPVAPGEPGRIVVTGFQNRHMPLIRYSIGDTASKSSEGRHCTCGCQWPVLDALHGRTQDLVKTKDGNRIGLLEAATLRTVSGITESQIIQTCYESFTFRIVAAHDYHQPQAETVITQRLAERLGYPVHVRFEYVNTIEKTDAGKHRAVIVDF